MNFIRISRRSCVLALRVPRAAVVGFGQRRFAAASNSSGSKANGGGDYSDTLLLPQTAFPLRANAAKREPRIRARAANDQLYAWQAARATDAPLWVTHDGPPYANGSLHIGHAMNKVLKDIVTRYRVARGYRVHFRPGWDCHGLPIELKATAAANKEAAANESASGDTEKSRFEEALAVRERARAFALRNVDAQRESFKSWAVLGEWDRPYLTLDSEYVAAQLEVLADLVDRGLVYRGAKPVYWSPSSRTALAEAELEYRDDHQSTAAWLTVGVLKASDALRKAAGERAVRLALWTTTPWTLPANEAVCVAADVDYALLERTDSANGSSLIMAAVDRIDALRDEMRQAATEANQNAENVDLREIARVRGQDLVGSTYAHPLRSSATERYECPVMLGTHVAADSGTGLVHTAPGHGVEDYVACAPHGIAPYCPVDGDGRYDASVNDATLVGLDVLDGSANAAVLERVRAAGALLRAAKFSHRYPYDWRTREPVILRATPQWFVRLTALRDAARAALRDVEVLPASGRARLDGMLAARDDWCVSRQRVWGVPLPALFERASGEPLLSGESVRHVAALVRERRSSDCWWTAETADLLPPALRGEAARYERGTDTLDVWFDSGVSWAGVLGADGVPLPSDLVLEGSDQHRGWFQSSLLTAVGARDGGAPYRTVLTHGFALDEHGRKMAKSLGNVLEPDAVVHGDGRRRPAYGVDVLRLWCASVDSRRDVQIGDAVLADVSGALRRARNTLRFLLANAADAADVDALRAEARAGTLPLAPLDRYVLRRLAAAVRDAERAYDALEFAAVPRLVHTLASHDLSALYLAAVKDRLYAEARDAPTRRAAQLVCAEALRVLVQLLAPIAPHTADDAHQHALGVTDADDDASVADVRLSALAAGWPDADAIDAIGAAATPSAADTDADWSTLLAVRSAVNGALERERAAKLVGKSLEADVTLYARGATLDVLRRHEPHLAELLIVSAVDVCDADADADAGALANGTAATSTATVASSDADGGADTDVAVGVRRAAAHKCERCWRHLAPAPPAPPLCARCATVLEESQ